MNTILFIEPGRIGDWVSSMGCLTEFIGKRDIKQIWVAREELRELVSEQCGVQSWGTAIPSRFRIFDIPCFIIRMMRLRCHKVDMVCIMSPGKSALLAQQAFPRKRLRGFIDKNDPGRCLGVDGVWRSYDVSRNHLSKRSALVLCTKPCVPDAAITLLCAENHAGLREMVGPAKRIDQLLRERGLKKKFVLFSIGARWPFRRWPLESWIELARALNRNQHRVVLCGPAGEREELLRLEKEVGGASATCLLPTVSIAQFVELARAAECMVTLDSGPMHIAAAVQTPCVALYGPSDPALTVGMAEGSKVRVVRWEGCPHWPCIDPSNSNDGGGCRQGEHICMKNLSARSVKQAIDEIVQ